MDASDYVIRGDNDDADFTLTLHRGEGMVLLAMDWRSGEPPDDFVGFGITYLPPNQDGTEFNVTNRINFEGREFSHDKHTLEAPVQKFRWVHFPRDPYQPGGAFRYTVWPMYAGPDRSIKQLRRGAAQSVDVVLDRDTCPGSLNVTFTRGFISSQSFVEHFAQGGDPDAALERLLPRNAKEGLAFTPSWEPLHKYDDDPYIWMGFEARQAVLRVLDDAIADTTARVQVVAYDLNLPEVVERLEALGSRLEIIIDSSDEHLGEREPEDTAEDTAAARLVAAGARTVKRQKLGGLQHNKTIIVSGKEDKVVCGSTNFSWRGFYVQNNCALVLSGEKAAAPFKGAFKQYLTGETEAFRKSPCAGWHDLHLEGIDAQVTFSPHDPDEGVLSEVAKDIKAAKSSVLYSLAFLYQTTGQVADAISTVTNSEGILVAGISDRDARGIDVKGTSHNHRPVYATSLTKNVPPPFSTEPSHGKGTWLHHKFVVIDFNTPEARVWTGSYNFSRAADQDNGENLLRICDRRIATSFAVEAVRLFDHYEFRVLQQDAERAEKELKLQPPPTAGEDPWFKEDFTDPYRVLDRKLFS